VQSDAIGCIADGMLEIGITNAQLDELNDYDGTGPEPNGLAIYEEAHDECLGSVEDRLREVEREIEDS